MAQASQPFAMLLRQHRLDAGLTQGALAERAGLSPRTVQHLEAGLGQPLPESTRRLADALRLMGELRTSFNAAARPARWGHEVRMRPAASTQRSADPQLLTNFPPRPTPLIGRDAETGQLCGLLLDPAIRLVTLTGPGGTGKTRLAIEVGAQLADWFTEGVVFVDLTPIRDPALVCATIGQALGVWDTGHQPILERLRRLLGTREFLLVLDNFEQVLPAGLQVGELLTDCPGLKVLVTSRSPLRLSWEHVRIVAPLALPDAAHFHDTSVATQAPAVALFAQRARALQPDFSITTENVRTVSEICVHLDGLPLAIELAAARIALLPPGAMLARLAAGRDGSALRLLARGARDRPSRHQTMHEAIAWSYELLSPDERATFERLAAFVGTFTLEAAQAVCDPDCDLAPEILDLVDSLVDKSLVIVAAAVHDEPRYRLPETIRQFALERLGRTNEGAAIPARHAAHFIDLAAAWDVAWRGPDVALWLDRLEADLDNLRAAMEWCAANPERRVDGLRLGGALFLFWDIRGYQREGRARLENMLKADVPENTERMLAARAKALLAAGWLAMVQADYPAGFHMLEESLAISRTLRDESAMGITLHMLTSGAIQGLADKRRTEGLVEEELSLGRRLGDTLIVSWALFSLGLLAWHGGDDERARSFYEDGLALAREIPSPYTIPFLLQNLGLLAWRRGDHKQALALECEALAIRRDIDDKRGIALSLEGLAWLATARRQPSRAARLFGAAEALREAAAIQLYAFRREDHDRCVAIGQAQLGAGPYAAAWNEGRARALHDTVAEALSGDQAIEAPRLDCPLSPRELEVAGLIAQGLTNHDIAQRLVIGRRTAESHAASILGKLGLSARPQIAVWFVENVQSSVRRSV